MAFDRRDPRNLPLMWAELAVASWETIARRSFMIVSGECSPAEYRRMVAEKAAAAGKSVRALASGAGPAAALAPFHSKATANAKRLRRRRSRS